MADGRQAMRNMTSFCTSRRRPAFVMRSPIRTLTRGQIWSVTPMSWSSRAIIAASNISSTPHRVRSTATTPNRRSRKRRARTSRCRSMARQSGPANCCPTPMPVFTDSKQTGLRFFTVYGPWGRPDMAYWSFTDAILEGRPSPSSGRASCMRDFTYHRRHRRGLGAYRRNALHADPGEAPHRIYNLGNQPSRERARPDWPHRAHDQPQGGARIPRRPAR